MAQPELDERLSRISTFWSMVVEAHGDPTDAKQTARNRLLQRYSGAAYRYLLGAVRDPDTATELTQEFALRFIRGDFHRADPKRGRFRDYVKTALVHLVTDYYRSRQAWPKPLADDVPDRAAAAIIGESADDDFLASWRAELLERHLARPGRFELGLPCRLALSDRKSRHVVCPNCGGAARHSWQAADRRLGAQEPAAGPREIRGLALG